MKNNNIIKIALLGALVMSIPADICATTWSEWLWSFVPTQWANNLTTGQKVALGALGTAAVCTGLACLYKRSQEKKMRQEEGQLPEQEGQLHEQEERQLRSIFNKYGNPVMIVKNLTTNAYNLTIYFSQENNPTKTVLNKEETQLVFTNKRNQKTDTDKSLKFGKINILVHQGTNMPTFLKVENDLRENLIKVSQPDWSENAILIDILEQHVQLGSLREIILNLQNKTILKNEIKTTLKQILQEHGYNPDNILPQ